MPRGAAGRGLTNIEHLYYRKLIAISHHLSISTDPLVKLRLELDNLLPLHVSVMSQGEAYCSALSLPVDLMSGSLSKHTVHDKQMSILIDVCTDLQASPWQVHHFVVIG